MSIATYYKGRLSFSELLNMPIEYIHTFERIVYTHRNDEQEANRIKAEAMEDTIENYASGGR